MDIYSPLHPRQDRGTKRFMYYGTLEPLGTMGFSFNNLSALHFCDSNSLVSNAPPSLPLVSSESLPVLRVFHFAASRKVITIYPEQRYHGILFGTSFDLGLWRTKLKWDTL